MQTDVKMTNWQDWTLLALRFVLLLFAGALLFFSRSDDGQQLYASNNIVIALVVATIATILLAIPALFPGFNKVLPLIVSLGDWAMIGIFTYVAQGSPAVIVAIGGLLIVSAALRLGALWGSFNALGTLIVTALVLVFIFGFERLDDLLAQDGMALLTLLVFAVVGIAWAFTLRQHLETAEKQLVEIQQSRAMQLANMKERTRAIYDMAATMGSTLNYQKILDSAMNAGWLGLRDMAKQRKEGRLVSMVLLFRSSDNQLHVSVSRGLSRSDENRVIPGDEGIIGQALTDCIPVFGKNARRDPELKDFISFQSARSLQVIPLRAGYDNFGVMVYGSDQEDAFTDEHTELLTAIGTQATIVLQNAVLYQNLLSERDKIVAVEEEARKKLARDLHDGPTQVISAIAMRANIIQRMLEKSPKEAPAELKKVEELARQTTKEIRHMLFTLRPLVLESQGISAALNQFAEKMKETHNQEVAVRIGPDVERVLDAHQQGTIFYIIEEAVGNARKHAEASLITVNLMRQEDVVLVGIVDNGKGFDLSAVESNYDKRGSLGMVNLKERTELLGGTLRIESQIGKGTSITVLVPIKDELLHPSDRRARRAAATGTTSKLAAHAMERLRAAQADTDIYQ